MEELLENIILRNVTEEEYNNVKSIIDKERQELSEQQKQEYVFFQHNYNENLQGIYIGNNTLVGFFEIATLFGNPAINIYVLPPYRKKGIASLTFTKIIEQFGVNFSDKQYFYADVSSNNIASQKVMEKLGWTNDKGFMDTEMDGLASEFYKKENPYYIPVPKK